MSGHQSNRPAWMEGSATFVLFTNKDVKLHFLLEQAYFR